MLRGKKDDRKRLRVNLGWLLLLAVVIQFLAIKLIIDDPTALMAKKAVLAGTTVMIFVGLVPNLRWWAFRVIVVGLILNTIVIGTNGGLMPATPENATRAYGVESAVDLNIGESPVGGKNILLEAEETRLGALSDVIPIPGLNSRVFSVGDLFLYLGMLVFVAEALYVVTPGFRRRMTKNRLEMIST